MIGMARRLSKTSSTSVKRLAEKHRSLLDDADFLKSVKAGTTDEQNVKTRLTMATKAFG